MKIVEVEYKLSSVINDVSNMIFFKAKEKNLSFVTDVDESIPDHLFGDVVRIRQVITNILNNAVKYTDKGSVTLSADACGEEQEKMLRLTVKDTGVGIDAEFLPRVFEVFAKEDTSTTSSRGGSGLGLAVTKSIVMKLGGQISAQSEKNKGSTFTVLLPFKINI